ncbi:MAG: cellulase family glycosylhydrolase, partial [Anaerolineales bacterium]|nr:cellulase family glycosylhydrolase [Anaerolineales bacterium]
MEQVYRNGFKWIRIQSLTEFWGEGDTYKTFIMESIPPSVDEVISDYANSGVNIVLDLWMGAGLRPYGTTFQSEQEISRYLDYVRFVVPHFRGRIRYYQIWNEPGDMTVSEYANLISQAVPVIREEDPDARIIMNALTGTWENGYPGYGNYQRFGPELSHINGLLRSGVAPIVDGISWHPFYDNLPSDPYYQDYPQILQGIKELAASQGFTGEYFADEILWRTVTEEGWDGGPPVSRLIAAKYYTRAITEHRGLGVNVTINTFFQVPFLAPIHNLCDMLAGAEPTDITLSLETNEDANVRYYAFALPNGDRLVALWTNDEAVEDDPGVSVTLTIPGSSAQKVIGVDVFNGFEQELITGAENGDLVIRDLLVKDYPIILRFLGTATFTPSPVSETSPTLAVTASPTIAAGSLADFY